jgi:hypothetical protein
MTQPTSITTRVLLLQGLQELSPYREEDWDDNISELCQALLDLKESADETLCTVVKVSAAIEQLLLEVATRPSEGRSRELIIDTVAWLLLDETGDIEVEAEVKYAC